MVSSEKGNQKRHCTREDRLLINHVSKISWIEPMYDTSKHLWKEILFRIWFLNEKKKCSSLYKNLKSLIKNYIDLCTKISRQWNFYGVKTIFVWLLANYFFSRLGYSCYTAKSWVFLSHKNLFACLYYKFIYNIKVQINWGLFCFLIIS